MEVKGNKTVDYYHKTLGKLLYDYCGLARNEEGLKYAIEEIRKLKQEFYQNVTIPGVGDKMNGELEKAGRVADYFEIGELMCYDALT
jgi:succinate dehydrogenase / fumarate reductase flavoprotein subunit